MSMGGAGPRVLVALDYAEAAPALELAQCLHPDACRLVEALLQCGPAAQAHAKALLPQIRGLEGSLLAELTAGAIAARRASAEGREGITAFLEKRQPAWIGSANS